MADLDAPAPAPQRVLDGLLSATFSRPLWLLWRLPDSPEVSALIQLLSRRERVVVRAGEAGLATPRPSDVVVVCLAEDVESLTTELEAAQLVCVGGARRQRGVVHVDDLAHLLALASGADRVRSTSTYHEI